MDEYRMTIREAAELSKGQVTCEIGKRHKKLEELGMTHEEALRFTASIINLGLIANGYKVRPKSK